MWNQQGFRLCNIRSASSYWQRSQPAHLPQNMFLAAVLWWWWMFSSTWAVTSSLTHAVLFHLAGVRVLTWQIQSHSHFFVDTLSWYRSTTSYRCGGSCVTPWQIIVAVALHITQGIKENMGGNEVLIQKLTDGRKIKHLTAIKTFQGCNEVNPSIF